MIARSSLGLACLLLLGGCSYTYKVLATVIGGRLAFVVDPEFWHSPSCLNAVWVTADGEARAKAAPGDNVSLIGSGTFWHEKVGHDCVDQFPILYGKRLTGPVLPPDRQTGSVAAKALRIGVTYEITTTTGATGYGGGAFRILPNRHVVNVGP